VKNFFRFPGKDAYQVRFNTLLRPHLDGLYRLAFRFCQNRDDAEDLVQDLLIKLYPRLDELESIAALKPWLSTVLQRLFIDNLRRHQRSPIHLATEHDSILDTLNGKSENPAQLLENYQEINNIQNALAQLSEDQRVLIVLCDMEGYSLNELEAMLEVPIGTIKSRIHRARARLRELLGTI